MIFGLGGSAAVAMDLHHKLLRLGLDASVYTDPHLQVIACNYLDDRDAVLRSATPAVPAASWTAPRSPKSGELR